MYLFFILNLLPTCTSIMESLGANYSFFQENGEVKEIPQLNRPYGQFNRTSLFCPEQIDSCKWGDEWQRKLQTPIYFSTLCCVNVKQRLLAAPEQHSLRKGVVKVQRSSFIISFLDTAVALKTLYNVKLNPIIYFSSITCRSHSEMSSNGKQWIFQHFSILLSSLGSTWKVPSVVSKLQHHSHFHNHFVLFLARDAWEHCPDFLQ